MSANFIRIFAMSSGGVIMAQVGIVLYVYALAWKRSPQRRGLLPGHVIGVSVFAVVAEVVFMVLIADLYNRRSPLTVYGPLIGLANVDLIVALVFIFRFDRRRVSAAVAPDPGEHPFRRAEDVVRERRWWGRKHKSVT